MCACILILLMEMFVGILTGVFRAIETYEETPTLHNISNPSEGEQCSLS